MLGSNWTGAKVTKVAAQPRASPPGVTSITETGEAWAETDASTIAGAPMTEFQESQPLTLCHRCGHHIQPEDKFCAQCGAFLRDAYVDHRLLLALTLERDGHSAEARQEL